jgi:two-component system, sensor histidine kinase
MRDMDEGVSPDGEAAGWFFQNALDVFVVLRDNRVVSANPAWYGFTGWSEAETVGASYWNFIHPEDAAQLQAHVAQVVATGSGVIEHRCLTAAGEWRWTRSRAKRTIDGRTLLVVQDITAEREAAEYGEKVSRVAKLLGLAAGVYVWRFDAAAGEYDLNPLNNGDGDNGLRVDETTFKLAIHPEDRPRVDEGWQDVLRTGEGGEVTYRHLGEAGQWRRFHTAWQGVRVLPTGQWDVLGITQDITELADARDAALAAVEAKTQFLANMSHEIRTPMNGVLGVLHLLKTDVLTPGARTLVQQALAAGSTLAQLLNDIIDFSKIEGGRLDLAPEPLDVAREIDVVVGMVRADADARGLTLDVDCSAGGWVALDPVRLRQMVFNLVGNALKFTLEGGVRIRVSTEGAGERKRLRIEVQDTGVGICREAQPHLFDRFQQADGSSTRRFGGSGLGLAITKALAERMGGQIGFSSREGEGSTFWFEVSAPACGPLSARSTRPWLSGLKVLVVEDNATNRLVATHMLQEMGAQVETAEDGAEGVARAAAETYDLIFMDIQMPVMDGVQATREIRSLPGLAGRTPILAVTANVLPRQVESYLQAGMDGHIAKPISPAALMAEVARLAARMDERAA